MSVYNKLKNFSHRENWGDSQRINGLLLFLLDKITDEVKKYCWRKYKRISPCIIHCAYETSGHSSNSQHYLGNAADFHFNNISTKEVFEIIEKTLKDYQVENFVGLGLYPDWYNPGFHLDVRGYKIKWAKVKNKYVDIQQGINKL